MKTVVKNEVYTGTVTDYTHEGMGVIKVDGYPVFIKDVLKDEMIQFKVIKANKNFGFGRNLNILELSNNRVEPPCEYYYQCGGCQIQPLSYSEQLNFKKQTVDRNMNRQAKLDIETFDTVTSHRFL